VAGALLSSEISLAEHQRLHQRMLAVEEAARQLVLTDPPLTPGTPDHHQAWSSTVSPAKAQNVAVWSDDIALRSMAADQGVPAFGTYALLVALTEAGLIPDTAKEDTQTLAEALVAELPGAQG
jgi:hypothetical protein